MQVNFYISQGYMFNFYDSNYQRCCYAFVGINYNYGTFFSVTNYNCI